MPLPIIGTTDGAQSFQTQDQQTASATGTATFKGPSGVQGATLTLVVTIPLAAPGAVFTAILGAPGVGTAIDTWGGESTGGRFQVRTGQTVTVNATGLVAGAVYTCTFDGVLDVGPVQVVTPEPNDSALVAQIFQAVQPSTATYSLSPVVPTPSSYVLGPAPLTAGSILLMCGSPGAQTFYGHLGAIGGRYRYFRFDVPATVAYGGYSVVQVPFPVAIGEVVTLTLWSVNAGPFVVVVNVVWLSASNHVATAPGQPLDVVEYGGLGTATVNVANTANGQLLPVPAAGLAYRLHAWMAEAAGTGAGSALLLVTGGARPVYSVLPGAAGAPLYQRLGGQLVVTSVSVTNNMGPTNQFDLTYDLVILPSIT